MMHIFKLQCTSIKLNPNCEPILLVPGIGIDAPGEAASNIFPKKNGNKLVEKADNAMNINARMNLNLKGFKYVKRTNASCKVSLLI